MTLEQSAGPVTVRLDGGRFQARSMGGSIDVTATNRADVELADLARGAVLKLSEAATARLTSVAEGLEAEVNDAQLRADEIGRLALTGARSEIYASGIERVAKLEMSDSELELDLRRIARNVSLGLRGTGRTRIRLPTPCRVRIDGPRALASDRIDVTGCELRLPGQPVSSAKGRLIYGDRRPVTLTVTLDESVELEVEGLAGDQAARGSW